MRTLDPIIDTRRPDVPGRFQCWHSPGLAIVKFPGERPRCLAVRYLKCLKWVRKRKPPADPELQRKAAQYGLTVRQYLEAVS